MRTLLSSPVCSTGNFSPGISSMLDSAPIDNFAIARGQDKKILSLLISGKEAPSPVVNVFVGKPDGFVIFRTQSSETQAAKHLHISCNELGKDVYEELAVAAQNSNRIEVKTLIFQDEVDLPVDAPVA